MLKSIGVSSLKVVLFFYYMEIVINYWAVVVAAVANMFIGMLWYGPVFGKKWMSLMGFTRESMKKMPLTAMQAVFGGVITALIMSFVLAHDAFVWGAFLGVGNPFMFAFQLAFWIWLGYVATTQVGSFLWEGRSFTLFVFNATESFVSLFVMALILTFWK